MRKQVSYDVTNLDLPMILELENRCIKPKTEALYPLASRVET